MNFCKHGSVLCSYELKKEVGGGHTHAQLLDIFCTERESAPTESAEQRRVPHADLQAGKPMAGLAEHFSA